MLTEWLGDNDLDWFVAKHLQRAPYAASTAARNAIPLFQWRTLDSVLASPVPVDVLTVAGGRLMNVPRPRSALAARQLMSAGVSVVVRGAERHDQGLCALAASFERQVSPMFSTRLVAGDWLYIPSTWWHLVLCAEDALSISVGVRRSVDPPSCR